MKGFVDRVSRDIWNQYLESRKNPKKELLLAFIGLVSIIGVFVLLIGAAYSVSTYHRILLIVGAVICFAINGYCYCSLGGPAGMDY